MHARLPRAAAGAFPAGPPPRIACESMRTFVSIGMNGRTARWSFETNPRPTYSKSPCMTRLYHSGPPNGQKTDEKILYHIREASRLAEVIIAKAYEKQNVPFTKEDLMEYRGNIETMRNEH